MEKATKHKKESEEEDSGAFRKTLQIATIGEDAEGVLAGVRNAPANKLVLICYQHDSEVAKRLALKIGETLKEDVDVFDTIRPEHSYKEKYTR